MLSAVYLVILSFLQNVETWKEILHNLIIGLDYCYFNISSLLFYKKHLRHTFHIDKTIISPKQNDILVFNWRNFNYFALGQQIQPDRFKLNKGKLKYLAGYQEADILTLSWAMHHIIVSKFSQFFLSWVPWPRWTVHNRSLARLALFCLFSFKIILVFWLMDKINPILGVFFWFKQLEARTAWSDVYSWEISYNWEYFVKMWKLFIT